MRTAKEKKDLKNHVVFKYENEDYTYDKLFNLIKKLQYTKVGLDLDYTVKEVIAPDGVKSICIFFEESTTKRDWISNFKFWAISTKAYKGWKNHLRFCKGFFEEYNSGRDYVIAEVKKYVEQGIDRIYITGWSNGATVAQICCEDIYFQFGIKPILIACEPAHPCANHHTKKYVRQCIRDESVIFCYGMDVVPRLPPFPFGRKMKNIIYYIKVPAKFPVFLRKLIDCIKNTEYYHTSLDEGILKYMPMEN